VVETRVEAVLMPGLNSPGDAGDAVPMEKVICPG
jgi:hypothetical protein